MITEEKRNEIKSYTTEFEKRYLLEPIGQDHLSRYEKEKEVVLQSWNKIKNAKRKNRDITDMVLEKMLPYANTRHNREKGYRISVMPAITKDIRTWFENAGWQTSNNWTNVANALYEMIYVLIENNDLTALEKFENELSVSKGIKAGFITPTFYYLNPKFRVINNKTILTINFIHKENLIKRDLTNYPSYIEIIDNTIDSLNIPLLTDSRIFDMFCHYMCAKNLGGYAKYEGNIELEEGEQLEEDFNVLDEDAPPKGHWEAIYYLVETGKLLGYKTYVADPSKSAFGKKLGDVTDLSDVPQILKSASEIGRVDVIWYKSVPPFFLFEVEDGGNMRDALHRLYNTMAFDARFIIVCPAENRSKFNKWVSTAPYNEYIERYNFRTYNELYDFYKEVKKFNSMSEKFLRL